MPVATGGWVDPKRAAASWAAAMAILHKVQVYEAFKKLESTAMAFT
jgi:hypothetical protein